MDIKVKFKAQGDYSYINLSGIDLSGLDLRGHSLRVPS